MLPRDHARFHITLMSLDITPTRKAGNRSKTAFLAGETDPERMGPHPVRWPAPSVVGVRPRLLVLVAQRQVKVVGG